MELLKLVLMSIGAIDERWDDKFTNTLSKELEYVKSMTYDIRYPDLKARQLIPTSNEVDTAAETITYRQWDEFGMAQIISNHADDLPLVDALVEEFTQRVHSLGAAYQYSIIDIRRSARSGSKLDQRRARAARSAIENKIENIAALGDASAKLYGIANNPNVTLVTPITGSWATATADQIIADLHKLANSIVVTNKETFLPDTILLDIANYNLISTKRVSTTGDTGMTVLKSFLMTSPYIKQIIPWNKLAKANALATGPRAICYKKDPEVLSLEIPQEFEQLPPQPKNLAFYVPVHARIGGVIVYYPIAMGYMDGI